MNIELKQTSKYKGNDWWQWAIWLEGADSELDMIDFVIYTLHPTFPTPIRTIADRKSKFRLDSAGWGEFEIYLDLVMKSGEHLFLKHWLKLKHPIPHPAFLKQMAKESLLEMAPAVFISGSMADISIIQALRDTLAEHGLDVLSLDNVQPGLPWEKSIQTMLQRAVAAVFVISEWSSPFAIKEIQAALDQKVGLIIPVLIGEKAKLPKELEHLKSIRLKDLSEFEAAVKQLIKLGMSVF